MTLIRRGVVIQRTIDVAPMTDEEAEELTAPRPAPAKAKREVLDLPESHQAVTDRVTDMADIIGQQALLAQLKVVCGGAALRGTPMPHVLLAGPAGHGKTTLAAIIAKELGKEFVPVPGMMLRRPWDVVNVLARIHEPTVLFVDEIHALPKSVAETMYQVMEDGNLSVIVDGASVSHELSGLTIVGATTKPGSLTEPFRQRFGFVGTVTAYSYDELTQIVANAWDRVDTPYDKHEPLEVAKRSKGVPRRALHLAERVLDYCAMEGHTGVPTGLAAEALAAFGIDEHGLDVDDWRIIDALTRGFAGKTVGLDALAAYLDMDAKTISEQHEPFLCQCEIIARTKTGRVALPGAFKLMEDVG